MLPNLIVKNISLPGIVMFQSIKKFKDVLKYNKKHKTVLAFFDAEEKSVQIRQCKN